MQTLQTDVCVCGAGPAGFIAAIAAARNGARTILLEKNGFPGGLATAGLVGPISKFNFNGRRIVRGIPLEFIDRMQASGGAITTLPSGNIPFDAEIYKQTASEMLLEAGATPIFHATVYAADFAPDGRLRRAIASSEGSNVEIEADLFIDCTGTGSLIAGRPELWRRRNAKENTQPLSLIFKLGGVDTTKLTTLMAEDGVKYANGALRPDLTQAVTQGLISNFGGPWTVWGSVMRPREISVNCTRYGGDVTAPLDFSQAEVTMRKEIPTIVDVFRQADAAFADCFLQQTAASAGYRESREIIGEYRLTADDIFSQRDFPDTIAYGGHPVDRHLPHGSGQKVEFLQKPYAIPYRCLLSSYCPNLLVAGALAAAEPGAFATMRVQAQCMAMGQAAGTAAALCGNTKVSPGALRAKFLRQTLGEQGALIRLSN